MPLIIASDGSGNPKGVVAGFGAVMYDTESKMQFPYRGFIQDLEVLSVSLSGSKMTFCYGAEYVKSTNNRGELCGFLFGILLAKSRGVKKYIALVDSTYCMNTFETGGWLEKWMRDDIVKEKKNPDLVMIIHNEMRGMDITFIHQKAHKSRREINKLTGNPRLFAELNHVADQEAGSGKVEGFNFAS
jgi:ribonuclease HI